MFKITSEKELRECFRPVDRDEVIVNEDIKYPLIVKDYLSWLEPSGCRVYLVFNDRISAPPLGIVFRRDQSPGSSASMCEWCNSVRAGESVGLLTATASSKKRVGLPLCRDLSCKEKVESTPGINDFPLSLTTHEKIRRIISKMADFARRELF